MSMSVNEYADWTARLWLSSGRAEVDERDLHIMSYGLAGETGEVLDHLDGTLGTLDRNEAKKELGDVIYYWARTCEYFAFVPSSVLAQGVCRAEPVDDFDLFARLAEHSLTEQRDGQPTNDANAYQDVLRGLHLAGEVGRAIDQPMNGVDMNQAVLRGLRLAGAVGRVMERLKKRIRDHTFEPEALREDLAQVAFRWARLCTALNLDCSAVLLANIEKIEDRRIRGVQRGSGNNR